MEDYDATCSRCYREASKDTLKMSKDCHGMPYRFVCPTCFCIIDKIGYDGPADVPMHDGWSRF